MTGAGLHWGIRSCINGVLFIHVIKFLFNTHQGKEKWHTSCTQRVKAHANEGYTSREKGPCGGTTHATRYFSVPWRPWVSRRRRGFLPEAYRRTPFRLRRKEEDGCHCFIIISDHFVIALAILHSKWGRDGGKKPNKNRKHTGTSVCLLSPTLLQEDGNVGS